MKHFQYVEDWDSAQRLIYNQYNVYVFLDI